MIYFCCDELRRNALKGTTLNGIDYLEVLDKDAPTQQERQRTLHVHFINQLTGAQLTTANIQVVGGERIRNISVTDVTTGTGNDANILTVKVDKFGDYSPYILRIVKDPEHLESPSGYDPILSQIEFSFKVECASDFDCKPTRICPPEVSPAPEINYLGKDYETFRQLMLDRITLLMPKWQERHAADLGVALVELLAYVGDHLSYWQDAVGTEAYLATARRRISIRRQVRLVDYFMQEGCNARAWVYLQVSADAGPLPEGTKLFTRIPGQPMRLPNDPTVLDKAQVGFETMHPTMLYVLHNQLPFYTWDDQRCCLPKGSTHATLKGNFPNLAEGDVLVFEEVLGPRTGQPEDADPSRRCALRLTKVICLDSNASPLTDPLNGRQITEIHWQSDDALPFPFCISSRTDAEHGEMYIDNVSVARGNIVLADHGLSIDSEPIPATVPEPALFYPIPKGADRCQEQEPTPIPPRYMPQLKDKPLTHAATYDPTASATAAMIWNGADVVPVIKLASMLKANATLWQPVYDLLNSPANDPKFVVETETDGTSYIRFGDDVNGLRPEPTTNFTAHYRIGNGVAGNVGAGALCHIVTNLNEIISVRNPLQAQGGVEPETIEDVRQRAPSAFRVQERAVTPDDYAEVTERQPQVEQAAATFRWTGSWHTVFVTVDRQGGSLVDDTFKSNIENEIEQYRMAGYDLEVNAPIFVPLEIEMHVCVNSHYFRGDVEEALLEVFSNRILPDGRHGLFYPDNFSFGQPVYLSPLYAAAQTVPGVDSVLITKFQRQGQDTIPPDTRALDQGELDLGRLEIARLDNDPDFPEHGVLRLTMAGGK